MTEPAFVNVYGAQKSIPKNQFPVLLKRFTKLGSVILLARKLRGVVESLIRPNYLDEGFDIEKKRKAACHCRRK
jgi:hypothetical protein